MNLRNIIDEEIIGKNNNYIDKEIKFEFKPDKYGDINCSNNNLTTLKGAPQKVDKDFYCYENNLTTLEGAPKEVCGSFICSNNNLTTLKGAPQKVGGFFVCSKNQLTTLEGVPQELKGDFDCYSNQLTTLKGAPKKIGGWFWCSKNKISKEEIVNYLKIAKIGGGIVTDYGKFKDQKEALEKLTTIKESYFNY